MSNAIFGVNSGHTKKNLNHLSTLNKEFPKKYAIVLAIHNCNICMKMYKFCIVLFCGFFLIYVYILCIVYLFLKSSSYSCKNLGKQKRNIFVQLFPSTHYSLGHLKRKNPSFGYIPESVTK